MHVATTGWNLASRKASWSPASLNSLLYTDCLWRRLSLAEGERWARPGPASEDGRPASAHNNQEEGNHAC